MYMRWEPNVTKKIEYPKTPSLGEWQAPTFSQPLSWSNRKKIWQMGKSVMYRRWLSAIKRERLIKALDTELDKYRLPDYDDSVSPFFEAISLLDKVVRKLEELLMRATFPLVRSGKMPVKVKIHNWLLRNPGFKYIFLVEATLWYRAAYWGFKKWRYYVYKEYWNEMHYHAIGDDDETMVENNIQDCLDDEEAWERDMHEQNRLFLHWCQLLGYSYEEATHILLGFYCFGGSFPYV